MGNIFGSTNGINMNNMYSYVLIIVFVVLMLIGFIRRASFNSSLSKMREDLVEGDIVLTDSGIEGKIIEIVDESGETFVIIQTGKNDATTLKFHLNAIYSLISKNETARVERKEKQKEKKKENIGIVKAEPEIQAPKKVNVLAMIEEDENLINMEDEGEITGMGNTMKEAKFKKSNNEWYNSVVKESKKKTKN